MDSINIEILDDGRVKILTDTISAANHRNADELLEAIEKLMAGGSTKAKRKQKHGHHHTHDHIHAGGNHD